MKILKYLYCSLIGLAAFSGCSPLKDVQETTFPGVPESFEGRKDTSSIASINWKEFFSDSTLTELIETAIENNQDLLLTLQRIEAAKSEVLLTRAARIPEVAVTGAVAQRRFGLYTMDGAGNISTEIRDGEIVPTHLRDYLIGIQSSWEVDIWGKLKNRKKAAVARYLASVEGKRFVLSNLVAEVARNYYELLALDEELEIIRETVKIQERALEIVRIQKNAGAANKLAVQQLNSQLLNTIALEKEVLQDIKETEYNINYLLGRYPQQIKRPENKLPRVLPVDVEVGIPSSLLANRPDIRRAELELTATKFDKRVAKAAFYPSLNIIAFAGMQAYKPELLFDPQSLAYSVIGGLAAPVINRRAIKAHFNFAKADQIAAATTLQQTILEAYLEVQTELTRMKTLREIEEAKTDQVEISLNSIETSTTLFKTGNASYLEVLLTQQNALNSRLELVNVRKRKAYSLVNIYKALGGGWR